MRRGAGWLIAIMASASASAEPPKVWPPRPIEWVRIEGGAFVMGSNAGPATSRPAHRVAVKTFEISKTEITVAQFAECVKVGECYSTINDFDRCNYGNAQRTTHPINCVDWANAKKFAKFAHARLPTEAEWEFAARSRGKDFAYPWGSEEPTCERAVMEETHGPDTFYGCGARLTSPVCSKPRGNTEQGLCDMSGNVSEWVADRFHASYDNAPSDSSAWQIGASDYPVIRGASFTHNKESGRLKTTARHYQVDAPLFNVGFRVARDVEK